MYRFSLFNKITRLGYPSKLSPFSLVSPLRLSFLLLPVLAGSVANSQTAGVGSGQTYATLNDAFSAINSGALTGSIKLEIRSNISQNATALLNASGTGSANYSTITIYPTGTYSITSTVDGPAIELAGADRVTVDGRINGANLGTPRSLTLENTSVGTNASLVRIQGGGVNNLVQFAMLKGSGGSSSVGLVTVDGTGNSTNNIVQYCQITNSGGNRPRSVFYVNTSGSSNAAIFFGNEVFDTFQPGADSKLVVITGTHTSVFIMNNQFYETAAINVTGAYTYRAISIEGENVTGALVQGNIIGGSQINAGGSPMIFTSSSSPQFDAIYVSGGSLAAPASIQGNTITNISFQSSKNNLNNIYSPGYFNAIFVSGANTHANIGTVTGNTIGSSSATGAIQLFPTNATLYCPAVMIFIDATGTVNCQNNAIGGITVTGAALAKSFIGILDAATTGTHLISGNNIGSSSVSNSIEVGANSLNTSVNELVWGIANLNITGDINIIDNTVANLVQQQTGPNTSSLKQLAGIFLLNGGNAAINNNTLHHLHSYSNMLIGGEFSSVLGITVFQNTGTVSSVSGNTIYELSNEHTGNLAVEINGIFFKGNTGAATLSNNFIHSLRLSSSNSAAKIVGLTIGASGGTATVSDNVISLGTGVSNGYIINGIADGSQLAENAHKFYFNTIYLAGTVASGSNTAALYLANATPAGREILNNILVNERSNSGGSARHYGLFITGTPSLTVDYNDYYTPNSGGVAGFHSSDKSVLPIVAGQDAASLNQNPLFTAAGGTAPQHYVPTRSLPGLFITGQEIDYLGFTRPASPYMGAFHYSSILPVTGLEFSAGIQAGKVILNWSTVSEEMSKKFVVQHSTDANNWSNIGTVTAAGTSTVVRHYQFVHATPYQGYNYYRLLQRDIDNRQHYSEVRRINMPVSRTLQLLGNPVTGGQLVFSVGQPIELSLLAADGRILWQKKIPTGYHQENIQLLSPGVYYLRYGNETVAFIK